MILGSDFLELERKLTAVIHSSQANDRWPDKMECCTWPARVIRWRTPDDGMDPVTMRLDDVVGDHHIYRESDTECNLENELSHPLGFAWDQHCPICV